MIDQYAICYTFALCNAIWASAWIMVTYLKLKDLNERTS